MFEWNAAYFVLHINCFLLYAGKYLHRINSKTMQMCSVCFQHAKHDKILYQIWYMRTRQTSIYSFFAKRRAVIKSSMNSKVVGRGVARLLTMWKHKMQGVWGSPRPPVGPGQSPGRGDQGAKPPGRKRISVKIEALSDAFWEAFWPCIRSIWHVNLSKNLEQTICDCLILHSVPSNMNIIGEVSTIVFRIRQWVN